MPPLPEGCGGPAHRSARAAASKSSSSSPTAPGSCGQRGAAADERARRGHRRPEQGRQAGRRSRWASAPSTRSAASTASTPTSATARATGRRWCRPGLPQTGKERTWGVGIADINRTAWGDIAVAFGDVVSPGWHSGREEAGRAAAGQQGAPARQVRLDRRLARQVPPTSELRPSRRRGRRPPAARHHRVDSRGSGDHDAGVTRLFGYLRRYVARYAVGGACLLVTASLAMAVPYLLKRAIDAIAARRALRAVAAELAGAIVAIALVQAVVAHAVAGADLQRRPRRRARPARRSLRAPAAPAGWLLPASADRRPDVAPDQRRHRHPHAARRRRAQPGQHAHLLRLRRHASC